MMDKDARIFIIGHTGMVGSAICRNLTSGGYTNLLLRDRSQLDLLRQSEVEEFFEREKPEYVFFAAARVGGILANNTARADFIYENLQMQNNVIATAHRYNVLKLLFLGSSCIYPKFAPQPIKEESLLTGELEPTNEPYAIAKIAGLKMCESFNRQYGTNFISAMPTNLYGPNDNFNLRSSHVLPALIRKFHLAKLLQQGDEDALDRDMQINGDHPSDAKPVQALADYGVRAEVVELWGTGTPRREFLHVDDCASALVFMMNEYDETPFLNVGSGEDITIRELAESIKDIVGYEGGITFNPDYPDGTPRKLMDNSRLRQLGWEPSLGLEEGIRRTYQWYLQRTTAAHRTPTENQHYFITTHTGEGR